MTDRSFVDVDEKKRLENVIRNVRRHRRIKNDFEGLKRDAYKRHNERGKQDLHR